MAAARRSAKPPSQAMVLSIVAVGLGLACLGLTVYLMTRTPTKRLTENTSFQQLWRLYAELVSSPPTADNCTTIAANHEQLLRQLLPKGSSSANASKQLLAWLFEHQLDILKDWDVYVLFASSLSGVRALATTCKTTLGLS